MSVKKNSMEQRGQDSAAENVEPEVTGRQFEINSDGIYSIGMEFISKAITYDALTGQVRWAKDRPKSHFKNERGCRCYKSNHSGKIAGTDSAHGYKLIQLKGKTFFLHRVVFFLCHGWLPENIDHKNCNRTDNRISNLRPASKSRNSFNRKINSNNKSGYKGVDYLSKTGRFRAQIQKNYIKIVIGEFRTAEEAHRAYVMKSDELFGEFSNHGELP